MQKPKYMNKEETVREKSVKRETRAVKTINSGAFWIDKGDIKTDECLIEHKMTNKKSIAVQLDVVEKIYKEATLIGKTPVLWYEIGDYVFVGKVQRRP